MAYSGPSTLAVLFDFDGVLADTEPYHWRAWREVLRPFGIELDWETFERTCIGVSDLAMLSGLCALSSRIVTPDQLRAQYPLKRKIFHGLVEGRSIIGEDIIDTVNSLHDKLLAVVTSSNRAEIEPILNNSGILRSLNTVVYGNDVRHYKPHPEPYLLAVERLGVKADRAVVFEDSAAGIQSARAAGCQVVKIESVSQLPRLVRAFLPEIFPPA